MKRNLQCDFESSPLFGLKNKRKLETLLKMPKYLLERLPRILNYHNFQIEKKDGNYRDIVAPGKELKKYQKNLLGFLGRIKEPDWLISGCKGRSYPDNAKYHQNSNYVLTIDIHSFYSHCKREYVFRFFHNHLNMSKDVAGALTDLTTYKGIIPTGCPTSQLLAFLAFLQMFIEIKQVAEKYECLFTLYVDDMTFSSKTPFAWRKLTWDIDKVLHKYGHNIKRKKIKYFSKNSKKMITGVIIDEHHLIRVPNSLRFKIVTTKNELLQYNDEFSETLKDKKRSSLIGCLLCARNIEDSIYPELYKSVRAKRI